MKVVLEHLKAQTVPHDMIEELMNAGVRFYENCLIVQVKDHRSGKAKNPFSASENGDLNIPFSIHNYEQWVTPSSYVPYPDQKSVKSDTKNASEGQDALITNNSKGKEKAVEPTTYTVVLFPTPLSMQEETSIQANTTDSRPGNRRTQGTNAPRTPASATTTVPSTPLSAIPPTPFVSGPPAKRQKMSINGAEIQGFESKIITATAPPLFLDPVNSLQEAHNVLESLTDPLHREKHPSRKTRKRTVAELAADERIAAQEQAFMLTMDERAGPNLVKATSSDEAGTSSFQPRFERFNAIQQIKAQHEEQARQLAQQKQRHEVEVKQREAQAKQQRERMAQADKERHTHAQMLTMQKQRDRAAQLRQHQQALAHNQGNGVMPNGFSQTQHSSPIIRDSTPQSNASPVVGNMMVSQAGGAPMQATSSGQGSSPGRPTSSMQHGHPAAGGVAMVHQRSRQHNTSRTATPQMSGTPHMSHATPSMPHGTPIIGVSTPTSHVPHGSPQNVMHNSSTNQHLVPNQRINGLSSSEQYQEMLYRGQHHTFQPQQHKIQQQQRPARQTQQPSPNAQMSQDGTQMHHMQQITAAQQAGQNLAAYRQSLPNQGNLSISAIHSHANLPNGTSPHPPQQHMPNINQQVPQQAGHPRPIAQVSNANQTRQTQIYHEQLQRILMQLAPQHGSNLQMIPQQQRMEAQRQATRATQEILSRHKDEMQNKTLQERQRHQMMQQMQTMRQTQSQAQRNGQALGGSGGNVVGMQPMGFLGGQGQGVSREQVLAQMGLPHLGGSGINGMNAMNSMNGMNGMGGMH
ncbi:MAG: hypothetical protein Q9163_001145 [Psora crenata]